MNPLMKKSLPSILFTFFLIPNLFCFSSSAQPTDAPLAHTTSQVAPPKTINIQFKNADIKDVLKYLSEEGKIDIVVGQNVKGSVTIFLDDVAVMDALDLILESNDLAYEEQSGALHVMTNKDYMQLYGSSFSARTKSEVVFLMYARPEEAIKILNQIKSKVGSVAADPVSHNVILTDIPSKIRDMKEILQRLDRPLVTKVYSLNYAKAEDIEKKLEKFLTKDLGQMELDNRTNKLVITDTPEILDRIDTMIKAFDEKTKEVLIEAKIVRIQLDDQYSLGVDWDAIFSDKVRPNFNFDAISGTVAGGSATGAGLIVGRVLHNKISGAIEALSVYGKTNIVSSPRLTVVDGEEAKVLVGTTRPYVTTTTTVPSSGPNVTAEAITFIEVGVTLTVTPEISNDDFVLMKIRPEVSSADTSLTTASGNSIPIKSTAETKTTVLVKNGSTIVIAGLIQDRDIKTQSKTPLLGDIPLIGNLFRSTNTGSSSAAEKDELVVFLTPYIINGDENFSLISNVHYTKGFTQKKRLEKDAVYENQPAASK